jgi:hypothetical protein
VASVSTAITQQDQFIQTTVPPDTVRTPGLLNVSGTFDASGTLTDNTLAAQTATTPEVDSGTAQFTDHAEPMQECFSRFFSRSAAWERVGSDPPAVRSARPLL